MKKIRIIIPVLFLLISCEKVIDIKVRESDRHLVIQANYTTIDETVLVSVTRTSGYFSSETQEKINSATITLKTPDGAVENIPSIGAGKYSLSGLAGIVGNYTMSVLIDGVKYSSSCLLNTPVQISPITTELIEENEGDPIGGDPEQGIVAFLNYIDPVNESNFYKVQVKINDTLERAFVLDDKYSNGFTISEPSTQFLKIGDKVNIQLNSISESVYSYFRQLESLIEGESSAPANPTYQWTNKALGYFSASSSSSQEITVQ